MRHPSIVLFSLLGACAADDAPLGPSILTDLLAAPLTAAIAPAAGGRGSTASVVAGLGDDLQRFELQVVGGAIRLRLIEGQLELEQMSIELGEIELPATVAPRDGAILTGLGLEVESGPRVTPSFIDETVVLAELNARAHLRWVLRKDGLEIELAGIALERLELVIGVTLQTGGAVVRLSGGQRGPLWSWLDHLSLADLELGLLAEPTPSRAPSPGSAGPMGWDS